jgi:hypothetical protein
VSRGADTCDGADGDRGSSCCVIGSPRRIVCGGEGTRTRRDTCTRVRASSSHSHAWTSLFQIVVPRAWRRRCCLWAQTEAGPVVEPVGPTGRRIVTARMKRSLVAAAGGCSSPPFVLLRTVSSVAAGRFLRSQNPTPGDGVLLSPSFTITYADSASSLTKARAVLSQPRCMRFPMAPLL